MKLGRFFWNLFLGNAALLGLVMLAGLWLAVREIDRFHSRELTPYLRGQALILAPLLESDLKAGGPQLDALAKQLSSPASGDVRVTVIAPEGRVLADSQAEPAEMESHGSRPEVRQALQTGEGESTRVSATVAMPMKYFALRIGPPDAPLGVLRLAVPFRPLAQRAQFVRTLLWPLGLVVLLAALSLAVGLAVLWSGRIRRLTRTAQALARGDLSARVDDSGSDEIAMLGRSLERMRERQDQQLQTIGRQRKVLEQMLARIKEGVIVARADGRIVLLNAEAARLLQLPELAWSDDPRGERMTVEDCVPQHDLQRLLLGETAAEALAGSTDQGTESIAAGRADPLAGNGSETRLDLQSSSGVVSVLARASDIALPPMNGAASDSAADPRSTPARLLVLTDVTDLTRAMRMRSDFVANASHELRTPLSAIRGAVQTLLSMDLAADTAASNRFLKIIERHSSRLEVLVSDLLELSRIESPDKKFVPVAMALRRVCDDLHARWADALAGKDLHWDVRIQDGCHTVTANAHLLHVVLDNLVDNAIKFTDAGGEVALHCECSPGEVAITVADNGCGIPRKECERVFERFYQVVSSRSESERPEKRGTGLGLSIVRHAMAAMGGSVRLQSAVGEGTRVTILLPQPARRAVLAQN